MSSHAEKFLTLFCSQKGPVLYLRSQLSVTIHFSLSLSVTCHSARRWLMYFWFIFYVFFFSMYELLFLLIVNLCFCSLMAFCKVKLLIRVVTLCVRILNVLIPAGCNSTLMISLSLSQHDIMRGISLSSVGS